MNSDSDDYEDDSIDAQDPDNTLKILITTDNHLGYMEKDAERAEDSFIAFEEALQIAQQEDVDFVLLGGDLFHENKPSRDCLTKCQKLLRKYCLGKRPINFKVISDQTINFGHTGFPTVNFNDPSLNIGLPVFSIHGNHDDPTGAQNLCALDILASAGLINYFGKCNNTQQDIQVNPVLLEKGETKLAMFGLGAIKDERLHYMFEKGAVKINRPEVNPDEYFNMFLIHQNRVVHGKKNYIPEIFLPDFLDLVLWGHEHECRIRPEYNELQQFYVTQPGSTVITSLSESEAVPKSVGILKICKNNFKLEPIILRTTRQFVLDSIVLREMGLSKTSKNIEAKIEEVCAKKINELIEECMKTRLGNEKQPKKPLIRLKVDYTDYEMINEARFAQRFIDKVANPRSILQFTRKNKDSNVNVTLDVQASRLLSGKNLERLKVEDLITKYFQCADERNKMTVLSEKGLGEAIQQFIEKEEKDAVLELVNKQIQITQKHLNKKNWDSETQLNEEIKKFQQIRIATQNEDESQDIDEISQTRYSSFEHTTTSSSSVNKEITRDELSDVSDEESVSSKKENQIIKMNKKPAAKTTRAPRKTAAAKEKEIVEKESFTNTRSTRSTVSSQQGKQSSLDKFIKKEPIVFEDDDICEIVDDIEIKQEKHIPSTSSITRTPSTRQRNNNLLKTTQSANVSSKGINFVDDEDENDKRRIQFDANDQDLDIFKRVKRRKM